MTLATVTMALDLVRRAGRVDPAGLPNAKAYHERTRRLTRARVAALRELERVVERERGADTLTGWLARPGVGDRVLPVGCSPSGSFVVSADRVRLNDAARGVHAWNELRAYLRQVPRP